MWLEFFLKHFFYKKEKKPYVPKDGMEAYDLGYPLSDNPFPKHTPEHSIWRDDWLFSKR